VQQLLLNHMLLGLDPVQISEELLRLNVVSDVEDHVDFLVVVRTPLEDGAHELVFLQLSRHDLDGVPCFNDLNGQVLEAVADVLLQLVGLHLTVFEFGVRKIPDDAAFFHFDEGSLGLLLILLHD